MFRMEKMRKSNYKIFARWQSPGSLAIDRDCIEDNTAYWGKGEGVIDTHHRCFKQMCWKTIAQYQIC